jgi:hypothetical protein
VLQPEHVPRLGTGRDEQLLDALERLDVEAAPERGLGERDATDVQEVVALALEARVGRDAHGHVEVARGAAARCGRSAPGEAQPLAVVDARGHLHVDRALGAHAPVATALLARGRDPAPGRAARDARRRGDDLADDRAPDLAHLARTAAHVAAGRVGARLAP